MKQLRGGLGNGIVVIRKETRRTPRTDRQIQEDAQRLREQLIEEEAEREVRAISRQRENTLGKRTF